MVDYKSKRLNAMNELDKINNNIFDVQSQILELEHTLQLELANKNKIEKTNDLDYKTQIALSRPRLSANEYLNDAIKMENRQDCKIDTKMELFIPDALLFEEERLIREKYLFLKETLKNNVKNVRVLSQEFKNIKTLERKELSKLSYHNNEINDIVSKLKPNVTRTFLDRKRFVAKLICDRYLSRVQLNTPHYIRIQTSNTINTPSKYKLINTKNKEINDSIVNLKTVLDDLYKSRDGIKNLIKLLDDDFNHQPIKEVKEFKEVTELPITLPITNIIGISNINLDNDLELADTLMNFNDLDRMLEEFNRF